MQYGTSSCWTGLGPSSAAGQSEMLGCIMAPVQSGLDLIPERVLDPECGHVVWHQLDQVPVQVLNQFMLDWPGSQYWCWTRWDVGMQYGTSLEWTGLGPSSGAGLNRMLAYRI